MSLFSAPVPQLPTPTDDCKDERDDCENSFYICGEYPEFAPQCKMTCEICGDKPTATVKPVTPKDLRNIVVVLFISSFVRAAILGCGSFLAWRQARIQDPKNTILKSAFQFRNGTGFSESCEENMTLSNVCIDGDRAVYLVMGCANWESPGQPEFDGGSDEAECGELLAKVATSRTPRADSGKSMFGTVCVILGIGPGLIVLTLLVVFLVKRHRAHKEKDKEATTGTTATMDRSQQLSGILTIIRDFMEGETVAEQTDLNSDGSRIAMVNRPVQPAEGTTTPQ
ncbi:hypothetical protein Tcan_10124 [Toxocara canis]|uniref:ShKT domain-containing protein n=1 Tax=Toxocara canis TaxID=6265 RepID=A0A0B2VKF1_TOXCA|nr:hypothetical protein Tcan_10124 [Toxocara canis]